MDIRHCYNVNVGGSVRHQTGLKAIREYHLDDV